jgi:two-component system chemotaxis sensor kinase CheA
MKMDMSQYLDVFLEESKEHLGSLNQRLIELEKDPGNIAALNEIFRAAHTLKGMSSTMGFDDLADLTHHMENVLSDLKEGILPVNSAIIDIIFQCFDRLQMIIDQIEVNGSGTMDNSELISILENIKAGDFEAAATIEQEISTPGTYKESFTFNEYDITVLKEAVSQNYNIYNIKVVIEQNCLMKSVRAFMVFKAVEEDGEVIKSLPSAQDLD